jgi:uncharacterized membrane protein YfcA
MSDMVHLLFAAWGCGVRGMSAERRHCRPWILLRKKDESLGTYQILQPAAHSSPSGDGRAAAAIHPPHHPFRDMTPSLDLLDFLIIALAAAGAGFINAIAGGGTLISFPALTFVGIPAVAANVTNTVALTPGYLGATAAQAKDLQGQRRRLWLLIPASVLGGLVGGLLLLRTDEKIFRELVPWLILLAAGLLAIQEPVKRWVNRRIAAGANRVHERWAALPVFAAAIYGGYFGAGLSVIVLAVLGLVLDDSLTRLNALKQVMAFAINVTAAMLFVFSGRVVWPAAAVMAVGALLGGVLGGRLAGAIKPQVLRMVVVVTAVVVAIIYLVR